MKILIVSDTHGRDDNLVKVLKKVKPIDFLRHCGDVEGSEKKIRELAGCPCAMVKGNNDFFTDIPREEVITLGRYKVLIVHGHTYGVAWDEEGVIEAARERGCDIVMYGHTHRPSINIATGKGGVTTINPGSLAFPRQEGRKPSYIVMEIDRFGKVHFRINYLSRSGRIQLW